VVLWGHSLGGFVCADLARRVPEARAIVLETTALNVSEIAAAWTPPWASAFVRPAIAPHLLAFDNAAALKEFTGPILVLTAARDSVLPARLSRSLAARLAGGGLAVTEVTFANAGHLDVSRQPQFAPTMQAFLARIGAPGAQP
jgi:pimeloyl-ACP methyl ester carboxylesterase